MIESVLPSVGRKGARSRRRIVHKGERARVRARLHDARTTRAADDYQGDLAYENRGDIGSMVGRRRDQDKVGSLENWARRKVQLDPTLVGASLEERVAYFRRMFPDNTIGRHAVSHIAWAIDDERVERRRRAQMQKANAAVAMETTIRGLVLGILAAGAHGELNLRLKRDGWSQKRRYFTGQSGRTEFELVDVPPRLLAGRHDVDAFVAHSLHCVEYRIVRAVAAELKLDDGCS